MGRSKRFFTRNSLKKTLDEQTSGVSEESAFPLLPIPKREQLVDLIGSGLLHNILLVSVFQNQLPPSRRQTHIHCEIANFKYLDGLTTRPRVLTHPNLFWCSASCLGIFFTLIITHSERPRRRFVYFPDAGVISSKYSQLFPPMKRLFEYDFLHSAFTGKVLHAKLTAFVCVCVCVCVSVSVR